tara:strand:- start:128 stop:484 length:357 start_codon:yes stop_codon:yes gene_type:complete
MKKIMENWNSFLNEDRIAKWSCKTTITLKKPEGAAAVIDDTLALIRGIANVVTVNSETDKRRTTRKEAYIDLQIKFTPRSTSIQHDVTQLQGDILKVSTNVTAVSSPEYMLRHLTRIQ